MAGQGFLHDWTEADIDTSPPNAPYFQRKIAELGEVLRVSSGASSGYCAVSGITPCRFSPIYAFGAMTPEVVDRDIASELRAVHVNLTMPSPRFDGSWFVPLIGDSELYGFYKLHEVKPERRSHLEASWRQVIQELSDHNYTRRVQFLSEPFSKGSGKEATFFEDDTERQINHLAALSFGADGAVLRRYDAREDVLRVAAFDGDIPERLLADRYSGELLSGAVLASNNFTWSVVELSEVERVRGCQVTDEALETLRSLGVKAAITARLDDPVRVGGAPFGTLSYYFKRPNRFSWRDVTLFLAFCKRASDALALAIETAELRERNRLIENQSSHFTQAEVATLLVHDIAHNVFHVGEHGEKLIEDVKRQLRHYRGGQLSPDIAASNAALQQAIDSLQKEVQDLRVVGRINDSDSKEFGATTFSLQDLVDELIQSMTFPLKRYNVAPKIDVPRDIKVFGSRRVLYHVLLNMLLNTIDAVRLRGRPATVHIAATIANKDFITIKFWDTGPGFNLAKLQAATDIFKIGKTTKDGGTGLGLPMARNLVARYFNGSLNLLDEKQAVFEIQIRRHNGD